MVRRLQRMFTLHADICRELDRTISSGNRSRFVERAIADRLSGWDNREPLTFRQLLVQLLLCDELAPELKAAIQYHLHGNKVGEYDYIDPTYLMTREERDDKVRESTAL